MPKKMPISKNEKPTIPLKMTPRQRLDIFRIGKETGKKYFYEVLDLLIYSYDKTHQESKAKG